MCAEDRKQREKEALKREELMRKSVVKIESDEEARRELYVRRRG